MSKKFVITCLINFLIAALMGLTLRYVFVNPIDINYRFLTHGHSHVAMLGWVYLMLYTLFIHHFVPDKKPIYIRLFWMTELAVVGMMISFPIQGYAAISISFSILHIFCSYYFVYLIWRHHKTESLAIRYLLRASLLFMLLSTIGVWCLGPAISILGQASAFYQIAIQFFLHFQFNGWFLIAVLTLFFNQLKIQNHKSFKLFFRLLIASVILTIAFPVSWFAENPALKWINGFGVMLQLMALVIFIKITKLPLSPLWQQSSKLTKYMYRFTLLCFVLKIGIQSTSLIPEIADIAYQYKNFVIGFIHLTMLGVITGFLFSFLLQSGLVTHKSKGLIFGIFSFILGFVLTELTLFIQGGLFYFGNGLTPNYYLSLLLSSLFLPLGISFIIYNVFKTKKRAVI